MILKDKPYLLALDGVDGSGKSTLAQLLVEHLQANGYDAILAIMPGGTTLGTALRILLKDQQYSPVPSAERFMFAAAYVQQLEEVIFPALKAKRVVICDRWSPVTDMVYGKACRIHPEWLDKLYALTPRVELDTLVMVEVDHETARFRRSLRAQKPVQVPSGFEPSPEQACRIEAKGEFFLTRVEDYYRGLDDTYRRYAQQLLKVDGTLKPAILVQALLGDLLK